MSRHNTILAQRLDFIATATGQLPAQLVSKFHGLIDEAEYQLRRQAALHTAQQHLDPEGRQSNWQTAQQIATGVTRLNRVRPGRVLTPLEEALTTVSQGAKSARRLHDDLTILRQK